MGVDYVVGVGIGRQIPICYDGFPYEKFYGLIEEYENDWDIMLTSQEYKGTECATTIFVGKLIGKKVDPRDAKSVDLNNFREEFAKVSNSIELDKLDKICEMLKNDLHLSVDFSDFGINFLVKAF